MKMKRALLIKIILMLVSLKYTYTAAQTNLVPNPSFEQYSACPYNQGQVNFANGWLTAGDSPDYFNTCDMTVPDFSVPYNWGGYQVPATGNAYCGIGLYAYNGMASSEIREFIGMQLSSALNIGTKYYVSFRTSLSINDYIMVNCACNNQGALFSCHDPSNVLTMNFPNIGNYAPQINNSTIITDTTDWTIVFGSFIADSAYQYIFIGNFFNSSTTDTLRMYDSTYCYSYYYVDDVCVSTDSLFALHYSANLFEEGEISVFPNPFEEYLTITNNTILSSTVKIFDNIGRIIFECELNPYTYKHIDMFDYAEGVYYFKFILNNKIVIKKVIKQ